MAFPVAVHPGNSSKSAFGRLPILRYYFLWEVGMGEAQRRKQEYSDWFEGLSPAQKLVAAAAIGTYEQFVRPAEATGMCYRITFFLKELLFQEHGIAANAVVGYINDGTDDVMISHAWLEHEGKTTDITLGRTDPPSEPGAVLILDRPLTRGRATYSYHREKGSAGEALERDAKMGWIVAHKRTEHQRMSQIAADPEMLRSFLDGAPDGLTYLRLAEIVRG